MGKKILKPVEKKSSNNIVVLGERLCTVCGTPDVRIIKEGIVQYPENHYMPDKRNLCPMSEDIFFLTNCEGSIVPKE